MHTAIDRFEEAFAEVLVGPEEFELHIHKEELPEGSKEGSVLSLGFVLDANEESLQRQKVKNLLKKLKRKRVET